MRGKIKQIVVFFFLTVLVFGVFGLGIWIGREQKVCDVCAPEDLDFSLFWQTWEVLQEKYVDKDEIDVQNLIYGAISGMVESLGDPYTVFLSPGDTKMFLDEVSGSFEGVGMEIDIRDGQLQVIAPLEGSPAKEAGLRAGDKIIEIDGKSASNITVEEAVKLIRGPKRTKVVLGIYREDWGEVRDIEIIRQVIEIPSLKLEIREDNIAYIHLYQFYETAADDFQKVAMQILASPAQKIILDLRNNPGGYLEISQDIASWFLEKNEIVAIEDFGEGINPELYKAKGNAKLISYPIVVLINEGSASASEILAGALRDNRGIKLIGQTSFGKGSVQVVERLEGGASLKVTVAKWLTPEGLSITEEGLVPDVEVEMTAEDYEEGRDPQLDKAIEILGDLN
ncbi:MAG: S41 family peptidase [Candidatus Nealsonbacteria bacterium]